MSNMTNRYRSKSCLISDRCPRGMKRIILFYRIISILPKTCILNINTDVDVIQFTGLLPQFTYKTQSILMTDFIDNLRLIYFH